MRFWSSSVERSLTRPARRLAGKPDRRRSAIRRILSLEPLEGRRLLAADVWTQRGGDGGHTSFVDVAIDAAVLQQVWSQPLGYEQSGTGSWSERAVAIDESHVYRTELEGYAPVGTYHVIAYDLQTGAEAWHRTIIGNAFDGVSEPSVNGGIVYVNRAGHSGISGGTDFDLPRIYGLDAATGATVLEQRYASQWGTNERPAIAGNQLVVEDGYYGGMSSYTASTLSRQWHNPGHQLEHPMAAFDDQYVYAYGEEVYRRTDGALVRLMTHPQLASVAGAVVADSGRLLFNVSGSVAGVSKFGVSAFDGDTHAHQWTAFTSAYPSAKAVGNGVVAVAAGNQLLILSEADGSPLQSWQAPSGLTSEIVLTRTHAFVQSASSGVARVHAIDLSTGQEEWSYEHRFFSGAIMEMAFGGGHLLLSHHQFVRAFAPAPANQAPTAADAAFETAEDVDAAGTLSATDPEGDSLTYEIVATPAHGTLTFFDPATGAFTYSPAANYHGADSFSFQANDGQSDSNIATVALMVAGVNDAPTAALWQFGVDEDTPLDNLLRASDIDGDPLAFAVDAPPAHGSVEVDPDTGDFIYIPDADFYGSDSFTFHVNDGTADSNIATIFIGVKSVNDAPVAVDAVFSLDENSPAGTMVGQVEAADIDSETLSYSLSGTHAAAFAIDEAGVLTVADSALLDFESHPELDLVVLVDDRAGGQTTASVRVHLVDVLEVSIDILPSDPNNQVNLGSKELEVAILAGVNFDPLAMVDLGSLRLRAPGSSTSAGAAFHPRHGYKYEQRDVNGDGLLDLVIRFSTANTGLAAGDTSLELEGALLPEFGGESFLVEQQVVATAGGKGKPGKRR